MVFLYDKDNKKFASKIVEKYFKDEMKFEEKDQQMVVWVIAEAGKKWFNHNIIVKFRDIKKLCVMTEDVAIAVWSIIQKINNSFYIDLNDKSIPDNIRCLLEDMFALNLYQFNKYKSKNNSKFNLVIWDKKRDVVLFKNLVDSLKLTRDLVNEPAIEINPKSYTEKILKMYEKNKSVKIEIIKGKDLVKRWLNWIYSVWKASDYDPVFVILKYKWSNAKWFDFWLIGKWVCFDSWWYNIKPTWYMEDMKSDMAWSASVLWAFDYLVKMKSKKNIVVWLPLVENMVSDEAYKPWDVIKMYNGKMIEVWNTDAEWRIILADALSYIDQEMSPKYMFDIATLTWAQVIALWMKIAAVFSKKSSLVKKIQKLSWEINERVWELPLFTPYFKSYKSEIADFMNCWTSRMEPWTINAWLFLFQFVKNANYVHIDIAWPSWNFKWRDELCWNWASWFGVRLLIKLVEQLK